MHDSNSIARGYILGHFRKRSDTFVRKCQCASTELKIIHTQLFIQFRHSEMSSVVVHASIQLLAHVLTTQNATVVLHFIL